MNKEKHDEKRGLVQKGTEELASRVRARDEEGSAAGGQRGIGHGDAASAREREAEGEPRELPHVADDAPMLLLLSGSPRRHNCVSLIDIIERGAREAGVRTQRFLLCEKRIDPCTGCDGCVKSGVCVLANRTTPDGRFADDYLELTGLLDRCDGLALVAPVYFSGPTAQLKALFDRFQPYWVRKYLLGYPFPKRRPSQLFVVGAGGDPHGFDPFVTISRSCLQIAGFELEKIGNFVGYVSPKDAPVMPTPEQAEAMNPTELAKAKAAVEAQEEFRSRALESGRMLGRMLLKAAEAARDAEAGGVPGDADAAKAADAGCAPGAADAAASSGAAK